MMNKKANLNQAFKELRKLGYFARQNFWCCQSCAWAAVPMDAKKGGLLPQARYRGIKQDR